MLKSEAQYLTYALKFSMFFTVLTVTEICREMSELRI
jgi:hypothetical protein